MTDSGTTSTLVDPGGLARTTSYTYSPDDAVLTTVLSDLSGTVSTTDATYDPLGRRVEKVVNKIEVLPVSPNDERIRAAVYRAIYGHTALNRYGLQAVPPIHIIVKNGQVTLEGVVNNELEKNVAFMRASSAGLSFGPVRNHLRVENPKSKS